ncbi:Uncharacterised protein [Mycolicibacterium vanbaalenii]|uniref:N-acetyltransferase domain-containing protein n=1 Tax=Mycolicibacterium vanbaalenii TaxID=110539 RepID=A0A5S9R1E4_MYCVN|nr:GNAT family N-acetyltransferase [Mycolicibacterium vanbaalenii]CAA0126547.1 Uncharacterised protein [Mycolicibacterium vanbaalenii]
MSPSNRIAVTEPAAEDFEQLPFWYGLAGVDQKDYSAEIHGFTSALQDGYLGVAVGKPGRGNVETLLDLDQSRWYYARTSARVLRLNGEPIGMLIMGAHWRLWEMMKKRGAHLTGATIDGFPLGEVDFMIAAMAMAKLHVLAVHPDQHGRGHGRRLIREALKIGKADRLSMLYGQFRSDRPHLRKFYTAAGFTVLDPGEPMPLYMATGTEGDLLVVESTETIFWTTVP